MQEMELGISTSASLTNDHLAPLNADWANPKLKQHVVMVAANKTFNQGKLTRFSSDSS